MRLASPPLPEFRAVFEAMPGLYLVLAPDPPHYTIVAVRPKSRLGARS